MSGGAAAVLALSLVLRGWVASGGFFYLDDFVFTARAATHDAVDPSYLLEPYNSHLMPGAYLWVWVLTRLLPLNYGAVVVSSLALQALLGGLYFMLLRRMFGPTPVVLVPFTVLVLSPITLPADVWWSAALNQLPQQIAMVAVLLLHVDHLRTGRVSRGLAGVLALAAGLAFSEKTVLAVPLVFALTALFFARGDVVTRVRRTLADHRAVWVGYAVVTIPYAVYYLLRVPSPAREPGSGASILQLVMESFARAVAPGLLGGPWHWAQIGYAGALADPGPFATGIAVVLVSAVVAGSCLLRRDAWRGWSLGLGYALTNLVLLVGSRAAFIGPVIAGEYRYVTDVALVTSLALALALAPLAGRWQAGRPPALEVRPRVRRWLRSPGVAELVAEVPRVRRGPLVAAVVVALSVSATWSTLAYDRFWRANPAKDWVETAREDLSHASPEVVLADAYVPQDVAWALLGRYATVSHLLSPLPSPPPTLADGPTDDALFMLDDDGHLRRATVTGVTGKDGPRRGCGWRVEGRPVEVPLRRETAAFTWTVRIGYISSGTTDGTVTVGDGSTPVTFHDGLGSVFLRAEGPVDAVTVETDRQGVVVCTDDVTVGSPSPVAER